MNKQIIEEAAEWFVEFNADTPDAEMRRRFDTWLRASPEHVRAFLEIVPIWEDGARLPLDADVTPEQLIERSRATNNVVPIQSMRTMEGKPAENVPAGRFTTRRVLRTLFAASFVVALISAALIWKYREVRYPTYTTSIGEIRSLVLSDNSTVELNTHSRIRIRYTEHERAIDLLQGQALFHVAKNADRPFVVYSDETRARAVGTRFDVYRKSIGTVITVVEGKVAVYSDLNTLGGSSQPRESQHIGDVVTQAALNIPGSVLLVAGDQLTVGSKVVQKVEHPSLGGVTAWTQRQLVFDFTPLTDVAEEFNRYNTRQLTVDPAQLGNFRISGIFSSTDPSSLVRFLRAQPGITVVELEGEIQVSRN